MTESRVECEDLFLKTIGTERFRLDTSPFFTRLVYLHGTLPISLILILILSAVVLAFALDVKFAIVALMIVFLIAPLAMAWLYLYWGMRAEARFNVTWHTLTVERDGVTVTLLKPVYETVDEDDYLPKSESVEKISENLSIKSSEEDPDNPPIREKITGWIKSSELRFDREKIGKYLYGGDGITIPVCDGKGFIAVPRSVFTTEEEYKNFILQIDKLYIS